MKPITPQAMTIIYILLSALGIGMCFTDVMNELGRDDPKYATITKQVLILFCYLSCAYYAFLLPHFRG